MSFFIRFLRWFAWRILGEVWLDTCLICGKVHLSSSWRCPKTEEGGKDG